MSATVCEEGVGNYGEVGNAARNKLEHKPRGVTGESSDVYRNETGLWVI